MKKFKAGETYTHGWITNSDLITNLVIEKRTEKSVWIEGKRKKIYIDKEGEYIFPYGLYSMCCVLYAKDIKKAC